MGASLIGQCLSKTEANLESSVGLSNWSALETEAVSKTLRQMKEHEER